MNAKMILFSLVLIFANIDAIGQSINGFVNEKEYKKISKFLDSKVLNRGFDGRGRVFVWHTRRHKGLEKLWNEVLFEMGIPQGKVVSFNEETNTTTIDSEWIFEISGFNLSISVLDMRNDNNMVGQVLTDETFNMSQPNRKSARRDKVKNYIRVLIYQLYQSID